MPVRQVDVEIDALAKAIDRDPERILEIFQALQARHNGLTTEMIDDVARAFGIPAARAHGVATFYSMLRIPPESSPPLFVCDGVACWLKDGGRTFQTARERGWNVQRSSCLGLCDHAQAAFHDGRQLGPLTAKSLARPENPGLAERSITVGDERPGEIRMLLHDIEEIDPYSIDSALEYGAYRAIRRLLDHDKTPDVLLEEVQRSGVLGRGGAGFPAGRKWIAAARESARPKYVVCNADESEPLTIKDRVLIETNPHQVIEGMILCGYAIGSTEGYIYIRGEYEPQARILEHAIRQAEQRNLLGANILGSDFSFTVHVHRGAGAYICGEASAMLSSMEGKRGLPRFRPPRTTTSGFRGKPTVVNNVETFAAAAWVALHGADAYLATGDPDYPGTKLYAIFGHVRNPGLFEAPYRITLRQIIEDYGGGMADGSDFHFALTGGAAGTIVGPDLLDTPIDFHSTSQGIMLGAGGFLICDQTVSPVAVLRELAFFFEQESCGKCTPCRIGTVEVRALLDRMLADGPLPEDLARLSALATSLQRDSFCALGESVADPVFSAITHFPELFKPEAKSP
jgi:NADH-quinone oxidoreductase subunit F